MIIKNIKKISVFLIACIICFFLMLETSLVSAQSLTESPYRSDYPTDSYSNALGMNGVVLAYSTNSMYSNPANLSFLLHPATISFDHYYDASNGVQFENLTSIVYKSDYQKIAVGLTLRNSGYGSIEKSLGLFSPANPDHRFKQIDFAVGYSTKLLSTLSIGALFDLSNGSIKRSTQTKINETTASLSLGFMYFPAPGIQYGLALKGIGNTIEYTSQNGLNQIKTVQRHQSLALGIALHYPNATLSNQPYLNINVTNEKIFSRKGLLYELGLEVLPIPNIGLRTGYIYSPDLEGLTIGFGLNFHYFMIDYALSPSPKSTNQYQQLALSIKL
jgi:hypothetical protein